VALKGSKKQTNFLIFSFYRNTKKSLLLIEDSLSSPIPIESLSTTLIPIEHTAKESLKTDKDSSKVSSKTAKESSKESLQNLETNLKKFSIQMKVMMK
jgi:hypothetical protein